MKEGAVKMAEDIIFEKFSKRSVAVFVFIMLCNEIVHVSNGMNGVPVHYMWPVKPVEKMPNGSSKLEIYCYEGCAKTPYSVFTTVVFQIHVQSGRNGYKYYQGSSPEEVMEKNNDEESSWSQSLNFFSYNVDSENIILHTFEQMCVGIKSSDGYRVVVDIVSVDLNKVGLMLFGLLLFYLAPRLIRNELFFYVTGIMLGICFSLLIIMYFTCKLIPKKTLMLGAIVSSWSVNFFIVKYLLNNFHYIVNTYFHYIVSYIIGAGFLSFAICYRMGIPTNPRSMNLIQWTLQGIGLVLIWNASSHCEIKSAIIFLMLVFYKFSSLLGDKIKTYLLHKYPPKHHLLSEEEFIEQGVKETQEALKDLKEYCRSPQCDQWKTVLNVRNSRRFAEFMNGESHVSNEELLAYEHHSRTIEDDIYTDDSSSDADIDNSIGSEKKDFKYLSAKL